MAERRDDSFWEEDDEWSGAWLFVAGMRALAGDEKDDEEDDALCTGDGSQSLDVSSDDCGRLAAFGILPCDFGTIRDVDELACPAAMERVSGLFGSNGGKTGPAVVKNGLDAAPEAGGKE